jgi:hypothetical protein
MKQYPSILGPSSGQKDQCYAFVKYDGSNIRAEWSKKRGWYKFGSRNTLFDQTHPIFGSIPALFMEKYGDSLPAVFTSEKMFRGVESVIVYAEWFGAQSLAGMHKPDDKYDIVLFDVNPHKKGFLAPKQFLDCFGHLPVAEVVYQGNYGQWLIDSVKNETIDITSKYEIKSDIPEGVVCKGTGRALRGSNTNPWMAKIKTKRYKDALKALYEADWLKYWGIEEEF